MAGPASLRDRWTMLSPRERRFVAAAAAVVLLFLFYLLLHGRGGSGSGGVELTDRAPPPSAAPSPPPVPPSVPAPTVPSPSAADLSGLVLKGVFVGGPGGGAAVIGPPQGPDRLIRVGRPVAPGTILAAVGPNYAKLATPSGDTRLDFRASAAAAPTP